MRLCDFCNLGSENIGKITNLIEIVCSKHSSKKFKVWGLIKRHLTIILRLPLKLLRYARIWINSIDISIFVIDLSCFQIVQDFDESR